MRGHLPGEHHRVGPAAVLASWKFVSVPLASPAQSREHCNDGQRVV